MMHSRRTISSHGGPLSWCAGSAGRMLLSCASFVWLLGITTVEATITVVSSGQVFPSEPVAGLGQHMWKGYEYVGRLQYLPHHMDLCDIQQPVTITVPKDSVPVALLASAGGCTKEDQARIASTLIQPQNVVSFLIVEDVSRKKTTLKVEEQETDDNLMPLENAENEDDGQDDEEFLFNILKQGVLSDDTIKLAVLKIGRKTYGQLLSITAMESQTDRASGGTKITLNSKVPNQTVRSILAWATMSIAFCCCSCFCVSLAYRHGVFTIETENDAPPPRPVRRRLTVAQVREKFPSYRYYPHTYDASDDADGENDEEEGLETSSQALVECSICLDDFLPGQRVRQLPCGHVFHSTCIARWLVERNAVCPLCKLDVFEEEESSSEEEEEAEADPLISEPPTPGQELANQAVASNGRSSWFSFGSSSRGSTAPGTRWAMRWLSRQRRRGNGDGDMLTEMTNPLLAADRHEAVEVVGFQSAAATTTTTTAAANTDAGAPDTEAPASTSDLEQPPEIATESMPTETNENGAASTPVEV